MYGCFLPARGIHSYQPSAGSEQLRRRSFACLGQHRECVARARRLSSCSALIWRTVRDRRGDAVFHRRRSASAPLWFLAPASITVSLCSDTKHSPHALGRPIVTRRYPEMCPMLAISRVAVIAQQPRRNITLAVEYAPDLDVALAFNVENQMRVTIKCPRPQARYV